VACICLNEKWVKGGSEFEVSIHESKMKAKIGMGHVLQLKGSMEVDPSGERICIIRFYDWK